MQTFAYLLFYLIAAGNILFGMARKRSRFLYIGAFFVIFALMTFYSSGPDIGVYMAEYNTIGNYDNPMSATYMEWGYTLVTLVCSKSGLNFFAFRAVLTVVAMSLFASSIRYYRAQGNLIIGFYMLYLFFFDTIQIRNFFVQFIILFGTRYLLQKGKLASLKYIVCVALAAGFHSIAWVYLSLILVRMLRKQRFYKYLFTIVILQFLVFVVFHPMLPRISSLLASLGDRASGYLSGSIKIGWFVVLTLYLLGLFALYFFKNGVCDKRVRCMIDNILKINIILGLFLPLTFFNNNFNRIFRNGIILTQIGIALIYTHSPRSSKASQAAACSLVLINVGWIYSDIFARYDVAQIITPIFESNLLLNGTASSDLPQYVLAVLVCLVLLKAIKVIFARKKRASIPRNLVRGGAKC